MFILTLSIGKLMGWAQNSSPDYGSVRIEQRKGPFPYNRFIGMYLV